MQLTTVVLGLTAMISGSLAVAVPARDSFGSPELSVPADMQLQACAYPSCDACIEYCWGIPCPPGPRACNTQIFVCLSSCGYTGCCSN